VQVDFNRALTDIIHAYSKHRPITHNLMGGFTHIDYYRLAADLDIVSWDNYPFFEVPGTFVPPSSFSHEFMRGLKRQNVWVMEQASGPGGWTVIPPTTEPGRMRLWAYQAVSRGTDMVSFFRWRTNRFGTEQYWHGVLDHHGEPRRRHEELKQFSAEMAKLAAEAGESSVPADYALVFDFDTLWSYEIQPQATSGFNYREFAARIVDTLGRLGLSVDVVAPGTDLSDYAMVIVPSLHLSSAERAQWLRDYVEGGGRLVLGPRSGVRDMENAIVNAVLPGNLTPLAGVEVEEYDMFSGVPGGHVFVTSADGGEHEAFGMADILVPGSGAKTLLTYKGRYYTGRAAATENTVGKGLCYYLGTVLDEAGLTAFLGPIADAAGLSALPEVPRTVEVTRRVVDKKVYRFYLNHANATDQVAVVAGGTEVLTGSEVKAGAKVDLEAFGVSVIRES